MVNRLRTVKLNRNVIIVSAVLSAIVVLGAVGLVFAEKSLDAHHADAQGPSQALTDSIISNFLSSQRQLSIGKEDEAGDEKVSSGDISAAKSQIQARQLTSGGISCYVFGNTSHLSKSDCEYFQQEEQEINNARAGLNQEISASQAKNQSTSFIVPSTTPQSGAAPSASYNPVPLVTPAYQARSYPGAARAGVNQTITVGANSNFAISSCTGRVESTSHPITTVPVTFTVTSQTNCSGQFSSAIPGTYVVLVTVRAADGILVSTSDGLVTITEN